MKSRTISTVMQVIILNTEVLGCIRDNQSQPETGIVCADEGGASNSWSS